MSYIYIYIYIYIYCCPRRRSRRTPRRPRRRPRPRRRGPGRAPIVHPMSHTPYISLRSWKAAVKLLKGQFTPKLPTKIIPTKIAWLRLSEKSPIDMRIPPLKIKIMLQ